MTTVLSRPHVWRPGRAGSAAAPLLLLHGTGGDEYDLLPLAAALSPESAVLSVRGAVLEHGLPRFFRRHAEGVFDEDDLRMRTDELGTLLDAASAEYGFAAGSLVAVGFSNGANMASSLLLRRPEALSGAVLFAAMVPYRDPGPAALTGKWVVVSNGDHDPMATPEQTRTLVDQLTERGATARLVPHAGGHGIDPTTLPRLAELIATAGAAPAAGRS